MTGEDPGLYLAGPDNNLQQIISDAFVWWPFQKPDGQLAYFISQQAGMDVMDYSAILAGSDEYANGQTVLRQTPFLLNSSDSFNVLWAEDGTSFVANIIRPTTGTSEVLLFPVDDSPPIYLMAAGEDFQWER